MTSPARLEWIARQVAGALHSGSLCERRQKIEELLEFFSRSDPIRAR